MITFHGCAQRRARHWRRALGAGIAAWLAFVACGQPLPSDVPLGGKEELPVERKPEPDRRVEPDEPEDASIEADAASSDAGDGEADADAQAGDADDGGDAADAGDAAEAAAPPCDDSSEAERDCDALSGGDECFVKLAMCSMAQEIVKGAPFDALYACLERSRSCDEDLAIECILAGAERACVTPRATALCQDFAKRCPRPPKEFERLARPEACAKIVSSLKDEIREPLVGCLERQCDVEACLEQLPLGVSSY